MKVHWVCSVHSLGSICYNGCWEQKNVLLCCQEAKPAQAESPLQLPSFLWGSSSICFSGSFYSTSYTTQTMGNNRLNVHPLQCPPLVLLDQAIALLLQKHPPIAPVPAWILHGLQSFWGCTCSSMGFFMGQRPFRDVPAPVHIWLRACLVQQYKCGSNTRVIWPATWAHTVIKKLPGMTK